MAALREVDLSTGGCSSLELTMTKRFQGRRGKTDHIVLQHWLYKHNSCRKASPRKQNTAHGEASQQMVHQRKKEDPARDHSTGGGDPLKFIRTRVCSSFFSSTSGSGHISSTSYFCNLFFFGFRIFCPDV